MGFSMRMGMGLGAGMQKGVGGLNWTIAAAADGTKYVRFRCADEGQTITCDDACDIKLTYSGYDSGWVKSVDVPAGTADRYIYFRGNGTGGTLTIPKPGNVTLLYLANPSSYITGSINGMALTYLYLANTSSYITGSITGMALTYLGILGTGSYITGIPAQIGTPLAYFRIQNGTSYNYPWTSQTFGGTKQTWTSTSMCIDCLAAAPTPEEFDKWLGGVPGTPGLADVSNAGTASLTLKNTPYATEADDIAAGGDGTNSLENAGLIGEGSGYYRMTNDLGYTLILGE